MTSWMNLECLLEFINGDENRSVEAGVVGAWMFMVSNEGHEKSWFLQVVYEAQRQFK